MENSKINKGGIQGLLSDLYSSDNLGIISSTLDILEDLLRERIKLLECEKVKTNENNEQNSSIIDEFNQSTGDTYNKSTISNKKQNKKSEDSESTKSKMPVVDTKSKMPAVDIAKKLIYGVWQMSDLNELQSIKEDVLTYKKIFKNSQENKYSLGFYIQLAEINQLKDYLSHGIYPNKNLLLIKLIDASKIDQNNKETMKKFVQRNINFNITYDDHKNEIIIKQDSNKKIVEALKDQNCQLNYEYKFKRDQKLDLIETKRFDEIEEDKKQKFLINLINSILKLHKLGFVHGNLCPSRICFASNEGEKPIILGLINPGNVKKVHGDYKSMNGQYAAPERCQYDIGIDYYPDVKYKTDENDLYALGRMIIESYKMENSQKTQEAQKAQKALEMWRKIPPKKREKYIKMMKFLLEVGQDDKICDMIATKNEKYVEELVIKETEKCKKTIKQKIKNTEKLSFQEKALYIAAKSGGTDIEGKTEGESKKLALYKLALCNKVNQKESEEELVRLCNNVRGSSKHWYTWGGRSKTAKTLKKIDQPSKI